MPLTYIYRQQLKHSTQKVLGRLWHTKSLLHQQPQKQIKCLRANLWNKSTEQIIAQTEGRRSKSCCLRDSHSCSPKLSAHKVLRAKHTATRRDSARTKRSHSATQSHQFKQELGRLQGEQTRRNLIIVSCFCTRRGVEWSSKGLLAISLSKRLLLLRVTFDKETTHSSRSEREQTSWAADGAARAAENEFLCVHAARLCLAKYTNSLRKAVITLGSLSGDLQINRSSTPAWPR